MFTGRKKILKPDGVKPDEFEELVAQELFNLEVSAADIKIYLKDLYITAAQQIDISGRSKAIIIFVPYRLLQKYHRIQSKLVRELEKKFSGRHVVIIAQRTILNKNCRRSKKISGPRPRSRTLTHVHEAILDVRPPLTVRFWCSRWFPHTLRQLSWVMAGLGSSACLLRPHCHHPSR